MSSIESLDSLLRQTEEFDAYVRKTYPELYQSVEQSERTVSARHPEPDNTPLAFAEESPVSPLQSESVPETPAPVIDEDDLQVYFLRRKFEHLSVDSSFEHAPAPETIKRIGAAPAQLTDEELFLHALTKLSEGAADEIHTALALMEQRPGMNSLLAFLPTYTALENGASRSRIAALASQRLSVSPTEAPEREITRLSQRMLTEVMEIITEAEALQEAGYRNRQEALSKAAQSVRQRLSRL